VVYLIVDSSAETVGAFSAGFDTDYLHRHTGGGVTGRRGGGGGGAGGGAAATTAPSTTPVRNVPPPPPPCGVSHDTSFRINLTVSVSVYPRHRQRALQAINIFHWHLKLSVGVTSQAEILRIGGLFTQGWRPGPTVGESVGGILDMDSSDWSNEIRYHTFYTRPDTESEQFILEATCFISLNKLGHMFL